MMESKELPPTELIERLEDLSDTRLEKCLYSYWSKKVEVRRWSGQAPKTREEALSEIFYVDIDYVITEEEKEVGDALVLKVLPHSREMLAIIENLHASNHEIMMYKLLFSEGMKKIYRELDIEILVPKVLYVQAASDSMTLVMRNLRRDGFETIFTTEGLSLRELRTYMRNIAIFHACRVVYKAKEGHESMEKSMNDPPVNLESCGSCIEKGFIYLLKLFSGSPLSRVFLQWSGRWKYLLDLPWKKMMIQSCVNGDFWANNVLCNASTGAAKILDWQMGNFGNPVPDITAMSVMSTKPSVLENHLYEILGVYWDSYLTVVNKETFIDLLENVKSLWIHGLMMLSLTLMDNGAKVDAHLVAVVNFLDKRSVLKFDCGDNAENK